MLVAFVWWQRVTTSEPLVTLRLFRDRNFSLANIAICTVGFAITAQGFPLMIYAQSVRGFTPPRRRCCSHRWRSSPAHSPRTPGG
ncbi:hypothetical protein [Pseudonocardia sp. ICBG601]|uniref:hypothetical protein n=1 Tax=Pseudonocardia sp. ICBG601 TaxID=2846759 RepID=UPI001CF68E5D|nr:hypothetical protein [Pseudonocardia sp. ICBG601]